MVTNRASAAGHGPQAPSPSEREMLKAVHRLTTPRAAEGRPVAVAEPGPAHTGDLAEVLGVSPATVTATIKKLAGRGLVDHRLYHGVELTPAGRTAASAAIRRHRIVERFLADQLGYAWDEADRLAPTFEHELPEEVLERLFAALGRPTTCPHGYPIHEPAHGRREAKESA